MESLILTVLFFLVKINLLDVEKYRLDIQPIAPVYWIDSERVFVNEQESSFIYDVVNREVIKEYDREINEILGYEDGVYRYYWENRERKNVDEYSTHLTVAKENGEVVYDIELKPTVEVVECSNRPILRTVFPIQEKYYVFDDELYEVEEYNSDMLSNDYMKMLSVDDLGSYWVTQFFINW
jgi:hypothetical protein